MVKFLINFYHHKKQYISSQELITEDWYKIGLITLEREK